MLPLGRIHEGSGGGGGGGGSECRVSRKCDDDADVLKECVVACLVQVAMYLQ